MWRLWTPTGHPPAPNGHPPTSRGVVDTHRSGGVVDTHRSGSRRGCGGSDQRCRSCGHPPTAHRPAELPETRQPRRSCRESSATVDRHRIDRSVWKSPTSRVSPERWCRCRLGTREGSVGDLGLAGSRRRPEHRRDRRGRPRLRPRRPGDARPGGFATAAVRAPASPGCEIKRDRSRYSIDPVAWKGILGRCGSFRCDACRAGRTGTIPAPPRPAAKRFFTCTNAPRSPPSLRTSVHARECGCPRRRRPGLRNPQR